MRLFLCFQASYIKGGFVWDWASRSSNIDISGGRTDEETIRKSKEWLSHA